MRCVRVSLTNVLFGGMFVCNAKANIVYIFYFCWCHVQLARLIDDSHKFFIHSVGSPREMKMKILVIATE